MTYSILKLRILPLLVKFVLTLKEKSVAAEYDQARGTLEQLQAIVEEVTDEIAPPTILFIHGE
jgi:hypothetical protein